MWGEKILNFHAKALRTQREKEQLISNEQDEQDEQVKINDLKEIKKLVLVGFVRCYKIINWQLTDKL